jgi:uncharacterized protein (DUF736 family)
MQIRFYLNRNAKKNSEKSPDYWGYIKDENGEKRQKVSAWGKKNDRGEVYLSVVIDDIQSGNSEKPNSQPAFDFPKQDDDLPF